MKLLLKVVVSIHIAIYQISRGSISNHRLGLPVLLLTTTGRKSGKARTVALGYFRDGSDYVINASNAGRRHNPGWIVNISSTPEATIQIRGTTKAVEATICHDVDRDRLWEELVDLSPSYAKFQKKTARTIPVVTLRPL